MRIEPPARLPRIWAGAVLGAAVWWLLGLNLFVYHFAAFLFFLAWIQQQTAEQKKIWISPSAIFLGVIFLLYFFSFPTSYNIKNRVKTERVGRILKFVSLYEGTHTHLTRKGCHPVSLDIGLLT